MNTTNLVMIPQPQKLLPGAGQYHLPEQCVIGITDNTLFPTANLLRRAIKRTTAVNICAPLLKDTISIVLAKQPRTQGYDLRIDALGIRLEADSVAAAFWGAQTLLQIMEQCPDGCLPTLHIEDWPDFQDRGVCLDVSRGRVPKLERLMELADGTSPRSLDNF